jgi:hypothetical protein
MAESVIQGLFGLTPYQIQQQQYARNEAQANAAAAAAGQTPGQIMARSYSRMGSSIADMGTGMLGMQTPEMADAQRSQQIFAQSGGLETPEQIRAAASRFMNAGDNQRALLLVEYASQREKDLQEISSKHAEQVKNIALADKAMRENPNLATTEVGVEGKPGWTQVVLYDKTNPQAAPIPVGSPKQSSALTRISVGGGESRQPLAYVDPTTGQAVWGTIGDARGKQAAVYSPETKQLVATSAARGKELGEASGKAEVSSVSADATADLLKRQVNELLSHPGFESTVGATLLPGLRFVPGTDEAGFMSRFDQIKGGSFLKAYEILKGGGEITEIEGKKATDAMNRMNISTSEKEFAAAAKDFVDAYDAGFAKLKKQASLGGNTASKEMAALPPPSQLVGKTVRDTVTGIRYKSDGTRWVKQ